MIQIASNDNIYGRRVCSATDSIYIGEAALYRIEYSAMGTHIYCEIRG